MGFFDRFRGSDQSEDVSIGADLVIDEPTSDTGFVQGSYHGERVTFDRVPSPSGEWQCLYARTRPTGESPVVLVDSKYDPRWARPVTRAQSVAVADDGSVAVTDIGEPDDTELGGTLHCVNGEGNVTVSREFDANIWNCEITQDGSLAATATLSPDDSVYLFDVDGGEQLARYESPIHDPGLDFGDYEGRTVLYILDAGSREVGIDAAGDEVWLSEYQEREHRIEGLMEVGGRQELEEATELLEQQLEAVDDENKHNQLALMLGDTNWRLAKVINKEDGDTDEWWGRLSKAKAHYMSILSWSQGRDGFAKTQRRQAKYHLREGDDSAALELFENMADMEDELDADLLTDPNRETMEELRDRLG